MQLGLVTAYGCSCNDDKCGVIHIIRVVHACQHRIAASGFGRIWYSLHTNLDCEFCRLLSCLLGVGQLQQMSCMAAASHEYTSNGSGGMRHQLSLLTCHCSCMARVQCGHLRKALAGPTKQESCFASAAWFSASAVPKWVPVAKGHGGQCWPGASLIL